LNHINKQAEEDVLNIMVIFGTGNGLAHVSYINYCCMQVAITFLSITNLSII